MIVVVVQICSVLDSMSERYFKKDGNEWLSGKIHFMKCIIEYVLKHGIEQSLKILLKGRPQDGFKVIQCHHNNEHHQKVLIVIKSNQMNPMNEIISRNEKKQLYSGEFGQFHPFLCSELWIP